LCKTCCHDRIVARRKQTVVCEGFGFGWVGEKGKRDFDKTQSQA
jgi:hypothetical protein